MDEQLERLYQATTYRARTPRGVIALRIGLRDGLLGALLGEYQALDWAFLTAWNPRSVQRPQPFRRSF